MRDPRIRPGVFRLLRLTFGSKRQARADADAELDAYIEARVEHHIARGMTAEDARAEAIASFGAPIDDVRARLHSSTIHRETRMRNRERLEQRWKDAAFALRSLRNSPIFALTAILTIALGIGATTAIFSVVNSVVLRPLPYADPDRLAFIWMDIRARGVPDSPIPPGDLPDLIQQAPAFDGITGLAVQLRATFVGADARPEMILAAHVTPNFFSVLGTRITLGRNFIATDGDPPALGAGADSTVPARLPEMTVITDAFWRSHFGGDSSVIGKTVHVNDRDALIIGVTPPSFQLVYNASAAASGPPVMYQALRMDYSTASRTNTMFTMIGRLRTGATWAEAQHQLDGLAAELRKRFPIYRGGNIRLRPAPFTSDIAKSARPKILALMGAVGFVLLIACANVANLLLVRASLREREFAVRAAIGGSRSRLLQQMLIESATLGILGAALGLVFARLGIALLLAIAPGNIPRLDSVGIDLRVLTFTVVAALLSSLVFGVIPAVRASNPNLAVTLRGGGRGMSSGGGARLRHGVVVFEVALSFVLLVGSGLMIRSFIALGGVDPGFEPNNVLTFGVFNNHLRSPGDVRAFTDQLHARLHAIPGVVDVTASNPVPLDGSEPGVRWGPTVAADDPSFYRTGTMLIVRPNFFAVMKAKFLAGGTFTAGDNVFGSTAVVIDNVAAARAYPGMPLNDVIGKTVLIGEAQPYRVVGIVAHLQQRSLDDAREGLYRSDQTSRLYATPFWEVRTNGDPSRIIPEVRRAVGQLSAPAVLAYVNPLSDNVGRAMAATRFSLVLVIVFGAIAALLAAIGLYGVVATTVRERTNEIGIRLALGATSDSIMRLILRRGLILSGIGMIIGVVGALALTRVMSFANMLFGVGPTDPVTYAAMATLFAVIAACACWLPARAGMKLDPAATLRGDGQ